MPDCESQRPFCAALPAALMALAAFGNVQEVYHKPLSKLFRLPADQQIAFSQDLLRSLRLDKKQAQRDFAATAQLVLEEVLCYEIERFSSTLATVEGIVMTGGVALNVRANEAVRIHFKLPVFVPSAPGYSFMFYGLSMGQSTYISYFFRDDGVAIGGAWLVQPPPTFSLTPLSNKLLPTQDLRFLGMAISDLGELPNYVSKYSGRVASVSEIASLLANGSLVAVMRGRQETGPRALGHRSLFALPSSKMKDQINVFRATNWYSPVAVVLPARNATQYVETPKSAPQGESVPFLSPAMSFTPRIRRDRRAHIDRVAPAMIHNDGSTLVQTVTPHRDPWLHALLVQVGQLTGTPILINGAFKVHGKPTVNSIRDAIQILIENSVIEFLLIEDFLFTKHQALERTLPIRWAR